MANKVTGTTDTTGAISTVSVADRCVAIIGVSAVVGVTMNELFSVSSTSDASAKFGESSAVTKMVKILINNGVNNIKCVAIATSTASAYEDALEVTLSDDTIKMIVTETQTTEVISAVKTHLTIAEGEDMFRYSVFAPPSTTDTQTALITFAESIGSKRIFVPSLLTYTGAIADQCLISAGLAGAIVANTTDPALPLNGVEVAGFDGVSRTILDSEKKALANGGVVALYNLNGMPAIHRLVTSDTVNEVWQEGTTVMIADYVLESVERMLRANYKRTKNVARILSSIKTDVDTVLKSIEGLEIIENYDPKTLSVIKDPSDNYGALVNYTFDVVTPLYTISINQHMKL